MFEPISASKVVSPLIATTIDKYKIIKFIRAAQRFESNMLNGKLIGTQPLERMATLSDISGSLSIYLRSSLIGILSSQHRINMSKRAI